MHEKGQCDMSSLSGLNCLCLYWSFHEVEDGFVIFPLGAVFRTEFLKITSAVVPKSLITYTFTTIAFISLLKSIRHVCLVLSLLFSASLSLSCDNSFFFLEILFCFFPPHFFISTVLALTSVAMARSIQDGVLVLSTERKMNVAAMHHSLLTL